MPQETTTDNPSLMEQAASAVAQKTVDIMKSEANELLQQLLGHEKHIGKLHSSLDILMKRFFVEKSFFDRASEWYGDKPWWNKTLTAVSFVGISALAGAVFNLAALFTLIAVGAYALSHSLLNEHHTITNSRTARFCTDITEMEHDLEAEVEQLRGIETRLTDILISLCEEQQRLSEGNAELEETVSEFQAKTAGLIATIEQLGKTKDGLLSSNQQLKEQLDTFQHKFESTDDMLRQNVIEMGSLNQQLLDTESKLAGRDKDLEGIHTEYQKRLAKLTELEALFNEQLSILTTSIEQRRERSVCHQEAALEPTGTFDDLDEFDRLIAAAEENTRRSAMAREDGDQLIAEVDRILEGYQRIPESGGAKSFALQ